MFNLVGLNFDQRLFQVQFNSLEPRSTSSQFNSTNTTSQIGLINPSFENGIQGWFTNGPCAMTTNAGSAIHGNHYLVANRNGTETCSSIYQDLAYSLQTTQRYRLSVWVRSANATPLYGTVALWGIGPTSNKNVHNHFTTVGAGWQCVETTFVPTSVSASLRVEFYLRSLNGDYHFDHVQLSEQTTPLCPSIPLENPSFEQGTQGWASQASCALSTSAGSAYNGNYYLVANRNSFGACYSFYQQRSQPTEIDHIYRLSAWVRSPNGNPLNGTLRLWAFDGISNEDSSTNFTTSGTGWQCVETVFRSSNTYPSLQVEFYFDTMGSDYHFDHVQLSEQANPLCPSIPIRNPSIEQGTEGWLPSGTCAINRDTNAAYEGTGYIVAKRIGSGLCNSVVQDVAYPVQANRTYRVATWVRSPSGYSLNGTVALWGISPPPINPTNGYKNFTTVGSGWQCVEAVYSPTSNHPTLRIEFYLQDQSRDYHFDAVAVHEQATPICP
nr:carbohydrate binding domain-containing protein [Herpetosiphon llansteffanensis]